MRFNLPGVYRVRVFLFVLINGYIHSRSGNLIYYIGLLVGGWGLGRLWVVRSGRLRSLGRSEAVVCLVGHLLGS